MEKIEEYKIRSDGRLYNEIRKIELFHEIINNNGVISLKQGETHVSGTLGQPKDKCNINFDIQFYTSFRNEIMSDRKVYELRNRLVEVFKNVILSNQQINIELIVKYDDGSLLPALINITTLILSYHGIPIIDMCIGITTGMFLDLNSNEQNRDFYITLAYLPKEDNVIYLLSEGKAQKKMFIKALENGSVGCLTICKYFEGFLKTMIS